MKSSPDTPFGRTQAADDATIPTGIPPVRRRWKRYVLYIALLVLLFLVIGRAKSGPIALTGWHSDLAAAMKTAETSDRPLLLFFHARWCGACHFFKREVLVDPKIAARLQAQFVPMQVDTTSSDGPGAVLVTRFDIDAIPAVVAVTPGGRALASFTGAVPREVFEQWLDLCLQRRNSDESESPAEKPASG